MTAVPDRTVHITIETREGTLLYGDDQGRQERRAVAFLSLAMIIDEKNEASLQSCWRTGGSIGSIAQLVAEFYAMNPGVREAVEGLYVMAQQRRQQAGGQRP